MNSSGGEDGQPAAIGLCICTRNRPRELHRALQAVRRSTVSPACVVVSDDSDADQAAHTALVCATLPWVTLVAGPRRGLGANRNTCLRRLPPSISFVVFIDDDVVLRPEFVARTQQAISQAPPRTIITGWESKNGLRVTPRNLSFWGHQEVLPRGKDDYHAIVINATVFPRPLFEHAQFDERLRYGSEEVDMCAQAERASYRIRFSAELVNDHYPSEINRDEYPRYQEASRLYATYKRYRWLEARPLKAWAYAALAPLHMIAGLAKNGRLAALPAALRAIAIARGYARAYTANQGQLDQRLMGHRLPRQ